MVKNEENDECEVTGKVRTREQTLRSKAFPGDIGLPSPRTRVAHERMMGRMSSLNWRKHGISENNTYWLNSGSRKYSN